MLVSQRRSTALPTLLAFVIFGTIGSAQQPPLAEIAKKEAERRKTVQPASKVYTDADLKTLSGRAAPLPDVPAAAVTSDGATKSTEKPQSPQKASRDDALLSLDKRLEAADRAASAAEANYRRYMDACYGKVTTARPAVPPGIPLDSIVIGGTEALVAQGKLLPAGPIGLNPMETPNEETAPCRVLLSDINSAVETVNRELDDVENAARRLNMLPGPIRDLFAKHGFSR